MKVSDVGSLMQQPLTVQFPQLVSVAPGRSKDVGALIMNVPVAALFTLASMKEVLVFERVATVAVLIVPLLLIVPEVSVSVARVVALAASSSVMFPALLKEPAAVSDPLLAPPWISRLCPIATLPLKLLASSNMTPIKPLLPSWKATLSK